VKETRAFACLKRLYPPARVHWIRIEGYASIGCPDANGCCDGVEAWVEFKQFKKPNGNGKIKLDTSKKSVKDQMVWGAMRRRVGGRTFYGIMVDSEFFLIGGGLAPMLAAGVTYTQLRDMRYTKDLFDV
jgi:hypothetical protein